jgi:CHAT domain-containing protein
MFKMKNSTGRPSCDQRTSRRLSRATPRVLLAAQLCGWLWLQSHGWLIAAVPGLALSNEAQQAFDRGQFSRAAEKWEQALKWYRDQGNRGAEIQASVSLAAAYQSLGLQRRSVAVLEAAMAGGKSTNTQSQTILLKSKLAAALILTRDLGRAEMLLHESLGAITSADPPALKAQILNELGNLQVCQQRFSEAVASYETSAADALRTGDSLLGLQARCNAALAAIRAGEYSKADELSAQINQEIPLLSPSHAKGFLWLTAGQIDRQMRLTGGESDQRLLLRAQHAFVRALDLGVQLQDDYLETYALGYLAELYEQDGQTDAALGLARRAVFAAQQAQLPEPLYRWEWRTGRLLKAKGDMAAAVSAYRRAVQTLQPIRSDVSLGSANASRPQTFREAQGPLFLELADLLLLEAQSAKSPSEEQQLLREARDTVEQLKNVELNDYFCDDCVDIQRARTRDLESVDDRTAIVYLIPLPGRTEVLVGLRSGLKRFTAPVGVQELTTTVVQFRRNLETRTSYAFLAEARQLYDWLIRPLRSWLREHQVDTLVFVPDGSLRTIPLAALHDGERFLIQDLAIGVAPGLSLVAPQSMNHGKSHALLSGLSDSVQGFPALDFVPAEMSALKTLYPAETLLNRSFTLEGLQRKLEQDQYSIIHIASHGQFNADVRKTFVLTYDTKLTMNTLEALIRPSQYRGQPVELLVLSACQTAAGDDRAALGLAGVAVKAGARSALASLWFVNDQSTSALISEVYKELSRSPTVSKARALQSAQIKLLNDRRYHHPCYWSPFLIIGNWL